MNGKAQVSHLDGWGAPAGDSGAGRNGEPDELLVLRTLHGDNEAFAALYDRYAQAVRVICYDTTRQVPAAQDLSQESFYRAYLRLKSLRRRSSFGPWLMGIARAVCREWRRQQLRERHNFCPDLDEVPLEPPDKPVADRDFIDVALSKLPSRERLVIHAFYLGGESAAQLQDTLVISPAGLYKLLNRARRRLAELLDPDK